MKPRPGSRVYFIKPIGMAGPIKIGCSLLPEKRLAELTVWSPFPLEVIGSVPGQIQDEQFLHQCFSEFHAHREWFHAAPELTAAISQILVSSIEKMRTILVPKGSIRKGKSRPKRTESQRIENAYRCRIRATHKRLRKDNERGAWASPDDVDRIMCKFTKTDSPSIADLNRLDEYLADPVKHSVIPAWRRPKDSICIPVFELEEAL